MYKVIEILIIYFEEILWVLKRIMRLLRTIAQAAKRGVSRPAAAKPKPIPL